MIKDVPLLVDTGRGYTIKYKGKYLYSSVDPKNSVIKRLNKIKIKKNTLVFVPGFGLGYGLQELLNLIDDSCHILCIEVDMELMGFALNKKIEPIPDSPNISIIRADDPSKICMHIKKLGFHNFRRVKKIHLSAGYHLNQKSYKEIEIMLDNEIKVFWQNKMTFIHMGRLWIKNILSNLPHLIYSKNLNKLKTELPFLVIGAGPSLEYSINWIIKIRKHVIILAVDTALPYLGDSGIKPDLIFVLESQLINLQDFIPHTFKDVPVICDISSAPSITKIFKGNTYFFSSDFHPLNLFKRMKKKGLLPKTIPPLGSVGVAAVYTAMMLTKGPLILTGLDFSYTDNKTHARNTAFHMLMFKTIDRFKSAEQFTFGAIQNRPLLKIKGKNQETVLSDLVLLFYSKRINEVVNGSDRVFDIGLKGLETGANKILKLNELEDIVLNYSNNKYLESLKNAHADENDYSDKVDNINKFIKTEKKLLNKTIELLECIIKKDTDSNKNPQLNDSSMQYLKEMDYLYFFFPDKEELPVNKASFLVRVLKSAYNFKASFRKLEKIIESNADAY